MIIPSVDIQNGQAVQLVGGKEKKIDAGDPLLKLKEFSVAGEVAVIDLDAAMSKGSNKSLIERMVRSAPCRVGGGIRTVETAIDWLNCGAAKIILGTKAQPELLKHLPKERVIAALDAENGEILIEGWQEKTGRKVLDCMLELRDYVSGFLVTFVELEGRMRGTNLQAVKELKEAAGSCGLTIAGGVNTATEIYQLDQLGADAQVGMAIYSGNLSLAECVASVLDNSDNYPCIILDETGNVLYYTYVSLENISSSLKSKTVFDCRGDLTSKLGAHELIRITPDPQRLCLFYNLKTNSRPIFDTGLKALDRTILERKIECRPESYTGRLFKDTDLLSKKIIEEANELINAKNKDEAIWETADLFYFALTALQAKGGCLLEVEKELNRRNLLITKKPGNSK